MYDLKLLKRAKLYVDAMSQGINPMNGEYVKETDSLSQEKIQNCMVYISQILNDVIQRNERKQSGKRRPFSITFEQKAMVRLSDEPIGINELARRINEVIDKSTMRSVSGTKITSWLVEQGYLDQIRIKGNKTQKTVNLRSASFGISIRDRVNIDTGEIYKQPVYNRYAQQYILEHIEEIAARKSEQEQ